MHFFLVLCLALPGIGDTWLSTERNAGKPFNESITLGPDSSDLEGVVARDLLAESNTTDDSGLLDDNSTLRHAKSGEFPYVVLVYYTEYWKSRACTGVLISACYVLSSASCIGHPEKKVNRFSVYAGNVQIDVNNLGSTEQKRSVAEIHYYGKYRTKTRGGTTLYFYNLAILKLSSPFKVNNNVKPIHVSETSPIRETNCCFMFYHKIKVCIKRGSRCFDEQIRYCLKCCPIQCVYECTEIAIPLLNEEFTDQYHACPYPKSRSLKKVTWETIGGPMVCHGKLFGVGSWNLWMSHVEGYMFISTTPTGTVKNWIKFFKKDKCPK